MVTILLYWIFNCFATDFFLTVTRYETRPAEPEDILRTNRLMFVTAAFSAILFGLLRWLVLLGMQRWV